MKWWEWAFSGIGVFGLGLFVTMWKKSKKNDSKLTAQGARVSGSPVASGTGISQTVTETHHHHYGASAGPAPNPRTEAPTADIVGRKPNILFTGTETFSIVEYAGGVFIPREHAFPAALVKFSNDAVKNKSTKAVTLKATIVYREAGNEIRRVTGSWLHMGSGHINFDVDASHKLIICFIFKEELCSLTQTQQFAHRRSWWTTELHSFGNLENLTAQVRLTNVYSGYCYFDGEFDICKDPMSIVLRAS